MEVKPKMITNSQLELLHWLVPLIVMILLGFLLPKDENKSDTTMIKLGRWVFICCIIALLVNPLIDLARVGYPNPNNLKPSQFVIEKSTTIVNHKNKIQLTVDKTTNTLFLKRGDIQKPVTVDNMIIHHYKANRPVERVLLKKGYTVRNRFGIRARLENRTILEVWYHRTNAEKELDEFVKLNQ